MMKKIAAIIAAFTLALTIAPTPAHAAQSDCPNARLCFWPHVNYGGSVWVFDINVISQQPNGCLTLTPSARNIFTSLYARVGIVGSTQVRVWSNTGCTNFYQAITSNIADPNLLIDAPVAFIHDDIESISVRFV